jgi:CheY-like chemotaxis protein
MARILLADDDATVRDLVERVLVAGGHGVVVAQDGQEALALVEGGAAIDVLVTDVQMPGLDGISLAKRLRASRPALRVLLMSGYPEHLERGSQEIAGRIEVLTKPCSIEDIRRRLNALLA